MKSVRAIALLLLIPGAMAAQGPGKVPDLARSLAERFKAGGHTENPLPLSATATVNLRDEMPKSVPQPRPASRLQSQRLDYRPWRLDDAAALHPALSESVDELIQWIPWATPAPPTADELLARLEKWIRDFDEGTSFIYSAWTRDEHALVGGVGLYPRVGPGALEIGYWIRSTASGNGYATEASRVLTRAGFEVPGITRIEIHVDPRNVTSARIPAKLGYELTEVRRNDVVRDGVQADTAVYILDRGSWLASEGRQPA